MDLFTPYRLDTSLKMLGHKFPIQNIFSSLSDYYNGEDRYYHNTQHISDCLGFLAKYEHLAKNIHEIEIAIWFHDVVYDATSNINEEQSAVFGCQYLSNQRIKSDVVDRISALIMATKHGKIIPQTSDEKLLKDIDLISLGSDPDVFSIQNKNIDKEFVSIPSDKYKEGRIKFFEGMLGLPRIYQLDEIKDRYEVQARRNMKMILSEIKGK